MADFLTIGGVVVEVQRTGAVERAPEYVGESARAFDGTLRSTVRMIKRTWEITTGPMLESQLNTLRFTIANDVQVDVLGDMTNYAAVQARVRITEAQYVSDGTVDGFYRIARLEIKEI